MEGNMEVITSNVFRNIRNNYMTELYIALAVIVGIAVLAFIASVFAKRRKGEIIYDKADFVHKMLTKDNSVKHQLTTMLCIGLLAAWFPLFFISGISPIASFVVGCVFVLVLILKTYYKFDEYYDRVEYNLKELHRYGFMRQPVIIKWEDVTRVGTKGLGNKRKLIFETKKRRRITLSLNREGGYEFIVFCEKQLEGKNFEAIKIAKGRR